MKDVRAGLFTQMYTCSKCMQVHFRPRNATTTECIWPDKVGNAEEHDNKHDSVSGGFARLPMSGGREVECMDQKLLHIIPLMFAG